MTSMSEKHFNKLRVYFISAVMLFVLGQLLWEHLNGGIVSHHLLHHSDYPAVPNWWGIIILPLLAWFTTTRVKKRISFQPDDASGDERIFKGVLTGFFGMLLISVLQAVTFEFGYENITMYLALGLLLTGLFLPIYRAECILGHVLGAAFTFGAVIPIIGISVMAIISAFSNLCVGPLLAKLWRRVMPAH